MDRRSLSYSESQTNRIRGEAFLKPYFTGAAAQDHIRGLDTLRFAAALWVAFGHGAGLPLKTLLAGKGRIAEALAAANGVLFNGVAAVMVFFVISGFCIHHAWIRNPDLGLDRYFLRRYVRILLPLAMISLIRSLVDRSLSDAAGSVLWSIYCEIIYYTLYPILRQGFRRWGLPAILLASSLASLGLVVLHPSYVYEWQFGIGGTWLLCLPTWLVGCLIAEREAEGSLIRLPGSIWIWRGAAILYGGLALTLLYHGPLRVGLPISMLVFSAYLYFWIQTEILALRTATIALLEWAGGWSYSLYLIHNMVLAGSERLDLAIHPLLLWAARLAAILILSYAFYLLVERPSHQLARRAGRLRLVARPS